MLLGRLKQILNRLFTNPNFIQISTNQTNDNNGFVLLDNLLRNINIDIVGLQQASEQALRMSDMYRLVDNCILMPDEYTVIKTISMGGLSQQIQPINPIQPASINPDSINNLINGVGRFINTINDTAKSVLQIFQ